MSFCVGLTGGIGCGKTTVANLFAQLDVNIIDTDVISQQLTQAGGLAIAPISLAFGADYLNADGSINRAKMRQRIFADEQAKTALENIIHPLIRQQAEADLKRAQSPYVLMVVPLLFASPAFQKLVQRSLVVDCAEDLQVARVMQRSQLAESEVRNIMMQQTSRADRIRHTDDLLQNDAGVAELKPRVLALHQQYLALAMQNSN